MPDGLFPRQLLMHGGPMDGQVYEPMGVPPEHQSTVRMFLKRAGGLDKIAVVVSFVAIYKVSDDGKEATFQELKRLSELNEVDVDE